MYAINMFISRVEIRLENREKMFKTPKIEKPRKTLQNLKFMAKNLLFFQFEAK